MARPPHFVVTGSGRSGTTYTAAVLSAAGIPCGHEAVFHPRVRRLPSFGTWRGDASWLAAPFIADLPAGSPVLHQVRDPREVIASWTGLRFLATDGPYSFRRLSGPPRLVWHEVKSRVQRARGQHVFVARDYERFVAKHEPWVVEPQSTLRRCMRYWIAWNARVEQDAAAAGLPYIRFRLEDFRAEWPNLLRMIGGEPESMFPAHVSTSSNTRPRHDAVTEDDLRRAPEFGQFAEFAARYGYDLA